MQTKSNEFKSKESESPLISLIEKKKEAFDGVSLMRLIRRDFARVEEAREAGITWAEIAEAYGYPEKAAQARYAFFYERRRREKKGEVKTAPAQKIENEKQKSEASTRVIPKIEAGKNENPDDFFRKHLIN